jgi:eukaryotic-like serine/threonine-protein kinase
MEEVNQKRQLAAIMFTDIVGYTTMMEQNEKETLDKVEHYKKQQKEKVLQFSGNILKYLGDGSLVLFDSVYLAVECAIAIQLVLQKDPKVPIRIGIHTGEVIFSKDDVYGQGINLASRLQQFGIEGSIIISQDVNDKIKNHPELKSVHLGKHTLKNIQKKLDIYALATPGIQVPEFSADVDEADDIDIRPKRKSRYLDFNKSYLYILLFLLIGAAIIVFKYSQKRELEWALDTALPSLKKEQQQMINPYEKQNWDIYHKAVNLRNILKDNPDLDQLWYEVTIPLTINTDPPGANVYAKTYSLPDTSWFLIGKTPLEKFSFPRGLSRVKIDKEGFKTQYDVISRSYNIKPFIHRTNKLQYKLFKEDVAPSDMVYAPGLDEFKILGLSSLPLGSFWMDRYEVTNKQYKLFLDSGGYSNSDYWEIPFVEEGDTIAFNAGKKKFVDKTGWIGPANWELGGFPEGTGELPVTGISWYEAAAYAKFSKKSLPTIYHWFYASEPRAAPEIVKFGNYNRKGSVEKTTYNSMARFGTYDLPGNVSEWTFNSKGNSRVVIGGNYQEPSYLYNMTLQISPWKRNELIGFRCIRYINDTLKHQLEQNFEGDKRDYSKLKPVSDEIFQIYRELLELGETDLNPTFISKEESEYWSKEIISVDVPYDDTPMKILIFLPIDYKPPYQSVIFFPGISSHYSNSMANMNISERFDFLIKSGRAVIWPVYYSSNGRGAIGITNPSKWKQTYTYIIKDVQVTLDYLQTREDINLERIAYYGFSWGGGIAPYILASEKRLKLGILNLFGLSPVEKYRLKEFDLVDYLPRVKIPMLLLGGRYDFDFTMEQQQVFFDLLGTPKTETKWMIYESTHWIPREYLINESLNWLDSYFGQVKKK